MKKTIILGIVMIFLISIVSAADPYGIVFEDAYNIGDEPTVVIDKEKGEGISGMATTVYYIAETEEIPAEIQSIDFSAWTPSSESQTISPFGMFYYDEYGTQYKGKTGMLFTEVEGTLKPTSYYFQPTESTNLKELLGLEQELQITDTEIVSERDTNSINLMVVADSTTLSKIGGISLNSLKHGSTIRLNKAGEIVFGELTIGEGEGTFTIQGHRYVYPENTKVILDGTAMTEIDYSDVEEGVVQYYAPKSNDAINIDGASKITESNGVLEITGDEVTIEDPDGSSLQLDSGTVRYVSTDDFYMEEGGAKVTLETEDGTLEINTGTEGLWVTECNSANRGSHSFDTCNDDIYAKGENFKFTKTYDNGENLEYTVMEGSVKLDEDSKTVAITGNVIQENCDFRTSFTNGEIIANNNNEEKCKGLTVFYDDYKYNTVETAKDEFSTKVTKLAPTEEIVIEDAIAEEILDCGNEFECQELYGEGTYDCYERECIGISEEEEIEEIYAGVDCSYLEAEDEGYCDDGLYYEEEEETEIGCYYDYQCATEEICTESGYCVARVDDAIASIQEGQCQENSDCEVYGMTLVCYDHYCVDYDAAVDIGYEDPEEEEETEESDAIAEEELYGDECETESDCIYGEGGFICENGACVDCKYDLDCDTGHSCSANSCVKDKVEEPTEEQEIIGEEYICYNNPYECYNYDDLDPQEDYICTESGYCVAETYEPEVIIADSTDAVAEVLEEAEDVTQQYDSEFIKAKESWETSSMAEICEQDYLHSSVGKGATEEEKNKHVSTYCQGDIPAFGDFSSSCNNPETCYYFDYYSKQGSKAGIPSVEEIAEYTNQDIEEVKSKQKVIGAGMTEIKSAYAGSPEIDYTLNEDYSYTTFTRAIEGGELEQGILEGSDQDASTGGVIGGAIPVDSSGVVSEYYKGMVDEINQEVDNYLYDPIEISELSGDQQKSFESKSIDFVEIQKKTKEELTMLEYNYGLYEQALGEEGNAEYSQADIIDTNLNNLQMNLEEQYNDLVEIYTDAGLTNEQAETLALSYVEETQDEINIITEPHTPEEPTGNWGLAKILEDSHSKTIREAASMVAEWTPE